MNTRLPALTPELRVPALPVALAAAAAGGPAGATDGGQAPGEGALVNWLHENTQILSSDTDGQGRTTFHLRISHAREQQFTKCFANRPRASAAE